SGNKSHRHHKAAPTRDAKQRPHERIEQRARKVNDADPEHQIGNDEKREQGWKKNIPPDADPPEGRFDHDFWIKEKRQKHDGGYSTPDERQNAVWHLQ